MNAAARYIASVYESCIDRSLDLAQIGHELAQRGIRRTPYQLQHDLDTVFCFAGYSATHPAPAVLTQKQIDAEIERSGNKFGESSCKHIR